MDQRVRVLVHGDVQGVGFRDFVQRRAWAAGLNGSVRNRPDGAVEVIAEGPEAAVEELLRELRKGPRLARVERIDVERGEASGDRSGFRVTF